MKVSPTGRAQTFLVFDLHFPALKRGKVRFKFIQPVRVRTGAEEYLFFVPGKLDNPLPEFLTLESLAKAAGQKFGAPVESLLREGILPLYAGERPPDQESPEVLSELVAAENLLGKRIVYLLSEKLYVLVDELDFASPQNGYSLGRLRDHSTYPIPLVASAEALIHLLEEKELADAEARRAAEATQRAEVLRMTYLSAETTACIEAEPLPVQSLSGGQVGSIELPSRTYGVTHVGGRKSNEDAIALVQLPDGRILLVVADGMGGHSAGEVASQMAIRYVPAALKNGLSLTEAIAHTNQRIKKEKDKDPTKNGMGTTVAAALISEGSAEIAHVGDSRVYLIKPDGERFLLTLDHSLAVDVLSGELNGRPPLPLSGSQLIEVETRLGEYSFKSVILRALGQDDASPTLVKNQVLEPGDWLLLVSDGLEAIPPKELDEHVRECRKRGLSPQEAGDYLLSVALDYQRQKGGGDNISIIISEPI